MSTRESFDRDLEGAPSTLIFTAPNKPPQYGRGFVVRFAVPPRVGDILEVDQYSIKKLPHEELHRCDWRIVDVRHEINLGTEGEEKDPVASLRVTAHPHQ